MNLIFRFLIVLVAAFRRAPLGPLDTSRIRLRVLPNDLDFNMHMNNGRYLTIMDLGRLDLIVRNGLIRHMRKRGWNPVVANARIAYRRSLSPFEAFELESRVIGWDERSVYMEQVFRARGQAVAEAQLRAVFLSREGRVPTKELMGALGIDGPSPALAADLVASLSSGAQARRTHEQNAA